LFVLVDGWSLVAGSLVQRYGRVVADFSRRGIDYYLLFLPAPLFRKGPAPRSRLRQKWPALIEAR